MTEKGFLKFWLGSAENDFSVAADLFKLKRFNYCLFFCHLAIEKLLKGLIFKNTRNHAPPTHDLRNLILKSKIPLTDKLKDQMKEITSWNIKARYDDYKNAFYKKATREYTSKWYSEVKELIVWLRKQY